MANHFPTSNDTNTRKGESALALAVKGQATPFKLN
jgi:hypothetical protein